MAAFPGSHDPLNIRTTPSPLPGLQDEHADASFLFSNRGANNLAHASTVFPKRVPLHVLQKMTNGFSEDNELGSGAYGKVYKGVQKNGETIAVKLLRSMPGLGDEQFEKEFRNLSSIQHKNIVRLVGFCHETQREFVLHNGKMVFADMTHMALCFEYMRNGSLNNYLFDEYTGHEWPTRYAIIKGICEGLKYLHEELKPPIYHLDLKPANILLDDKMMPKLADFGLSRLFGQEQTQITESCIGTHGYLPPEYIERNVISNKLDIFSLGVIIIKIITGPKGYNQCAEMSSKQFIEQVHEKWENRFRATSMDALEAYCKQVMRCIEIALSCLDNDRHKRPSIGDIIDNLNKMETEDQGCSIDQVDICSTPAQESLLPAASYTTQETTNTKRVSRLREHVRYAMGDLANGLVKSVVDGAMNDVQRTIEEEAKLGSIVLRDLVFITGEFQMMRSFLNVAGEERVNNMAVRTWVRQMRELAYDLEDCIEFVGIVAHRANCWSDLLLPCLSAAPVQLAEAVAQIKERVEDVSMRNVRHRLIDSDSKPALEQQQPMPPTHVGYDTRRRHILGDLTQLITEKRDAADLHVISVWGADGGAGTTSIIRKSYSDPEVSHSFTCRAWVNLTRPFNPHEFVRSLMAHFYANSCQERKGAIIGVDVLTSMDTSATQGDLLNEFVQLVDKNRYLVVLEDLCTMAEWDSIRTFLPDRKNGSWIIVSSTKYEIASLCVGHPFQVLDLKHLPADEHSICAFLREGFQDAGNKRKMNNDSTSTSKKEISTQHEYLSHNKSDLHSYMIPNSKMKAASEWMQNSPLVGRRVQMNQLLHCTVQAQMNYSHVMSVWGIAGVGKSSLVRNFYCDRILENQQFQEYGWVGLSQSQHFNLRDFSRSLLMAFQSESLEAKETAPSLSNLGIKEVVQKCCELLSTRRCLVVIDGLQSIQEWDSMQSSLLLSRHFNSKTVIIVITTEASVATYCADNEELVFNVSTLEADAAFDLFLNEVSKKTPLHDTLSYYSGSVVLRELISKCGGLPLIIVAMGGILATNGVSWMDTASSINLRFLHELETNPEFDSLWDLFSWMRYCFRTCPDSVKPCIFYLAFFPRDHNIRRRRLVRRWIAEGYSRDSDDKSAEENGELFFSKLLNLSIIQQAPESATITFNDLRMVLCQVNGFLRECVLSRGMEEGFVFELAGTCSRTTQRSGRHLFISESWDRDRIVFVSIDFSRLRSMTVFGRWHPFFISESMKLLRVLDLENAFGVTDKDVEMMVILLPLLKFLSLRGCQEIFHLPSSLGNLRQLQTLDVTNTCIVTLPAAISKLRNLQYFRGGTTTITAVDPSVPHTSESWLSKFGRHRRRPLVGVEVPHGIYKLTALHTLGVVNIGGSAGSRAILNELKYLTQLYKLGVCGVNRRNVKAFSAVIAYHVHLASLSVWFDSNDSEIQSCLELFQSLRNLQSLKLYGLRDFLPGLQANMLINVAKLELEMVRLMEDAIYIIGNLPKLCILRLRVNQLERSLLHFCVSINGLEAPSYKKVKVLEIACRSSLHMTFGSETMKNLDVLKIDCCSGSSYQLSGLDHLSKLLEVWLKGSYEETLKQHMQDNLSNHPNKPVLKLEDEIPRSST